MFKLIRSSKSLKYITYLESKRNFQGSAICSRIFQFSPNAKLCKTLIDNYALLPIPECLSMLHYIWIDGTGAALRSKDMMIHIHPRTLQDFPICEANGAECYLAESTKDPDILLNPVKYFPDPFRINARCHNMIVLSEVILPSGQPVENNFRRCMIEALDHVEEHQVWFGMGQQFTMLDMNLRPLGWPLAVGYPAPEGPYCYGVGSDRVVGRDISEALFRAALYAGVEFTGSFPEKYLGMWKFHLSQVEGPFCADNLWLTRYILVRIAEEFGVVISFDPKPIEGDEWSTNALETYFSTICTRREEDGITEIEKSIDKLSKNHLRHMQVYDAQCGLDNVRRLGDCYSEFTSGVSDRSVSVRIPRKVAMNKRGWLEDLRPAANADPYQVCNAIVRTVLLDE